jgi:hypothetical protein
MQSVCTKIRAVQLREQADQELHLLEIAHGVRFQPFQDSINSGKE